MATQTDRAQALRQGPNEDASAVCEALTIDCSGLLDEAKKMEGFGASIAGLFVHSDAPNVKDLANEALAALQQLRVRGATMDTVRKSTVVLKPFLAACEQKHHRLMPYALTVLAKLVQRKLVSHEGRQEIIRVLITRTEKVKDERALLCALQISLALLQDPSYADDEYNIGQLLSLVLRIHEHHAVAMPTVAHTASSTIRQAVSLIFDHAMLPVDHVGVALTAGHRRLESRQSQPSSSGMYKDLDGLAGREVAALKLLRDVVTWAAHIEYKHSKDKGKDKEREKPRTPEWLNCRPPFPEFVLELLELILTQRAAAFHSMPRCTVALRNEVCDTLGLLLIPALTGGVPWSEATRILKCVAAILKRHVTLAPDKCVLMFHELLHSLQSTAFTVYIRCHVLGIFRDIYADPLLLYKVYQMYDQSMTGFDLQLINDSLYQAVKCTELFLSRKEGTSVEYRHEYLARMEFFFYLKTVENKEILNAILPDGPPPNFEHSADTDTLPAFLGLEVVMGMMSSLEQLAVRVRGNDTISALQQSAELRGEKRGEVRLSGTLRRGPEAMHSVQSPTPAPAMIITPSALYTMVDMAWQHASTVLDKYLQLTDRRVENTLTLPLVTAYQYVIYAAGVVHHQTVLDGFLLQLTSYAITGPEDRARKDAVAKASQYEGGKLLINTLASALHECNELWPKNRTVLKAVLELTKRLAEDLGSGWMYVLDVINCLDRYLDLPGAKWRNEGDDATARRRMESQGEVERERPKPGTGKDLLKEKEQWRMSCDEVFVTSRRLSSDAVVGLMGALFEVSRLTLSDTWRPFQAKCQLDMLKQALQVLKANLHLTQELWSLFLHHCMDVLRSSNEKARATALKALDEGIMKALSPEATAAAEAAAAAAARHAHDASTPGRQQSASPSPSPFVLSPAAAAAAGSPMNSRQHSRRGSGAGDGVQTGATVPGHRNEDIQNMLLVAVDGLFREHAKLDVQLGLLKIVVHVLQHYGEDLTKGWQPLLRLLEAASGCKEPALVTLGWQCVEMLCSDYLYMLPKEHIAKALDVLSLYARQEAILNVSLTAVTMLWNVADTLARSKGVTHAGGGGGGGGQEQTVRSAFADTATTSNRRDVNEAESVEMLLIAFRALRKLSVDERPEVRNSAVRTLYLAMASHGAKFPHSSLRECVWDIGLHLITTCHHMSETSSNRELGPSEIGKNKEGKVVTMLMHHSRNTEQKQWEETLTLALVGTTKVLRGLLPTLVQMEEWEDLWQRLMEVVRNILGTPRKGLSSSCTNLIATLVTAYGSNTTALPPWMWRLALQALDPGVRSCAGPGTTAPMQVRTELLACITAVHAGLKEQLAVDDVRLILGWLESFARYPYTADDSPALQLGLGPLQKAALAALCQLAPPPAGVWPDMIETLCGMLCPFKLLPYRNPPTSSSPSATVTPAKPSRPSYPASSPTHDGRNGNMPSPEQASPTSVGPSDLLALEAKALSTLWMSRCCELLAVWYKEYTPWQVRVATFPRVVGALSECMAMRHLEPADELWRCAALAFVAVVQSGLPSINIAAHASAAMPSAPAPSAPSYSLASLAGLTAVVAPPPPASTASSQPTVTAPADTWPVLARAFEMSLLGQSLPAPLPAGTQPNPPLDATRRLHPQPSMILDRGVASEGSDSGSAMATTPHSGALPVVPNSSSMSDVEVQAAVLDCLADTVLTSCQYAPHDIRATLVGVVDAGAASPLAGEGDLPAASRFSHACLSKLYVLCSRGPDSREAAGGGSGASSTSASFSGTTQDSSQLSSSAPKDQNARCLMEVAQVALPVFVARCEGAVRSFVFWERSARSAAVGSGRPPEVDVLLCDRTVHVLDLLSSLHVAPAVMDALAVARPEVGSWVELARAQRRRGSAGASPGQSQPPLDRREQTHLVLFYGLCAELLMTEEVRVRAGVRGVMVALGTEVGLPAAPGNDIPFLNSEE